MMNAFFCLQQSRFTPPGDIPVDAVPAGDTGIDLGQAAGPVETTTSQTSQTQTIENTPTVLIEALVQLLESKVVQ